jgi:pescadillo
LHHLVRERYPRFIDALSDLDDALTLTYLFAALPSEKNIKPKVINSAKSLAAAWGAYCATSGCITKSFISVKGVYLEATIKGTPIRWIVPHSFTQFMPDDVDYRVMSTFFEFYETLLHFVMFKLYNDIGVRYPLPLVDGDAEVKGSTSYILGGHLRSLTNAMKSSSGGEISKVISETVDRDVDTENPTKKSKAQKKKEKNLIKTMGAALKSIEEDSDDGDDDDDDDDVDISGPLKAALDTMANDEVRSGTPADGSDLDDEALKRRRLFQGLVFFLSREVPRGYLELVCLAYGGKIGWEGPNSPISVNDPSITHHIVDRPKLPSSFDSLPKSREFIQPQWILDSSNFMFLLPVAKYGVGATLPPHLSPWVDNEEEGYKPAYAEEIERLKNGESIEDIDEMPNNPVITEDQSESSGDEKGDEEEESSSEEDDEEEDAEAKKAKAEKKRKREEDEAHALAKSMMSKKAAHLYGRMQHGIAKKKASVDELKNRRKEIESSREKDKDGNTVQMQKVKRLREERKKLEGDYTDTGGSMKKSKKKKSKKSI